MTTLTIDLTLSQSGAPLPRSTTTTSAVTTTTIPPPLQPQQSFADQTLPQHIDELEQHMESLLQHNLALEERLDKHGSQLHKLENLNIPHQEHQDLLSCLHLLHKMVHLQQQGSEALSLSKSAASASYFIALTTSDTRYESTGISKTQELSPMDSSIQYDSNPDEQIHLSDDEDSRNDQLPKADLRKDRWKSLPEEEKPTTPKPAWTIPSSNISDVDWTDPEGDQVRVDVNRPLPLGGPPRHVTIQSQFLFNKDLEYLRHGSKGGSPALLISKIKAASYPNFGLELLVPSQMWIEDVCTYDISAKYGISHWWFNLQKFYINRHDSLSHRKEARSHMRILSVVRIKACSRYEYDYLSEIVLRRVDLQEHTID
nr:hypothetical protein [Tanacetum cinerariifolium]